MSAETIARAFGLRRAGREYTGKYPSWCYKSGFAVQDRKGGLLLLYCFAGGCTQLDLIEALRKAGLWPDERNHERPHDRHRPKSKVRAAAQAPPASDDLLPDPRAKAALAILRRAQSAAGIGRSDGIGQTAVRPDATNRRDTASAITATEWRPLARNTLKGFLTLALPSGLTLRECPLREKDGCRWITLPSRPQIDAEGRHRTDPAGKQLYLPIVEIPDRRQRERFQRAALATVDRLLDQAGDP